MPSRQTKQEPIPIIATVTVLHQEPSGVVTIVEGQPQTFPNLEAVFRTATQLLDEETQTHVRPDPTLQRRVESRFDPRCRKHTWAHDKSKKGTSDDGTAPPMA